MVYFGYTRDMPRPYKYKDEPLVAKSLKFPPSLWEQLERRVPSQKRSEFIRTAVEEKLERERRSAETPPIWEQVTHIFSDLTSEEQECLPLDLSENLDHYIYGTERKA